MPDYTNILAIDTALGDISAAVSCNDGTSFTSSFQHNRDALQKLSGLIASLLEQACLKPSDIDLVACTRGPGSFTGLRVGISAAKAFADAIGADMVGVSTLELLASRCDEADALVVPLIECCPGELYCGLYRITGEGILYQTEPDTLKLAEGLPEWLEGLGNPIVLGPAVRKYSGFLEACRALTNEVSINIKTLADRSRRIAELGRTISPAEFLPEYLRLSQAETRVAAKEY